jgi:hypothetical protein
MTPLQAQDCPRDKPAKANFTQKLAMALQYSALVACTG